MGLGGEKARGRSILLRQPGTFLFVSNRGHAFAICFERGRFRN
jgi:hypothetical protein